MSKLEILLKNDPELDKASDDYARWLDNPKGDHLTFNSLSSITLPKGKEEETLRQILIEARMKAGLALRFWYAVKLTEDKVSLLVSLENLDASFRFDNICKKHCLPPTPN